MASNAGDARTYIGIVRYILWYLFHPDRSYSFSRIRFALLMLNHTINKGKFYWANSGYDLCVIHCRGKGIFSAQ